jgi:hypothetical protein
MGMIGRGELGVDDFLEITVSGRLISLILALMFAGNLIAWLCFIPASIIHYHFDALSSNFDHLSKKCLFVFYMINVSVGLALIQENTFIYQFLEGLFIPDR